MTQDSLFWTTNGLGDGADFYTRENMINFFRYALNGNTALEGPIAGTGSSLNTELQVTGTGSPLSVNTGAAFVYGFFYLNDAAVSLAVATPAATAGGHVVLRADWALQTVRLYAVRSDSGDTAIPSLVQSAGTTWEIRLASFQITSGGVITVTDTRDFCHYRTALVYRRRGNSTTSWAAGGAGGANSNFNPGRARMQIGAESITPGAVSSATAAITFPDAFNIPPVVFLTTDSDRVLAGAGTVASSGFNILISSTDGANLPATTRIHWMAIGNS